MALCQPFAVAAVNDGGEFVVVVPIVVKTVQAVVVIDVIAEGEGSDVVVNVEAVAFAVFALIVDSSEGIAFVAEFTVGQRFITDADYEIGRASCRERV